MVCAGAGALDLSVPVVVSAGIAIAGALMAGIDSKHETHAERSRATIAQSARHVSPRERACNDVSCLGLALPLSLLASQVPLAWNRFYRGWRIVFLGTESQSAETELLKFGASDLLEAPPAPPSRWQSAAADRARRSNPIAEFSFTPWLAVEQTRAEREAPTRGAKFMDTIATIEFDGAAKQGTGVIIVRAAENAVAICVSLRDNGDAECAVSVEIAIQIRDAIELAIQRARL